MNTTSSAISWGIVGPGNIARKFARDLRVAGGELRAVCGRDMGRARAFAAEYGARICFDEVAALAAEATVEMVYIATPHNAHCEAARMLMEAGKAVLCEKPLTVNAGQARELIGISQATGVFLMEAMWMRTLPTYAKIREWLDEGRIGRPRVVSSAFCIQPPHDPESRFYNPALAGGGLLDLGVYNLAASQLVMGLKPQRVAAVAGMSDTGVDEMLAASLFYENGGVAQFVCGLSGTFENSLVIGGDKGFIRVPSRFLDSPVAFLETDGKTEEFRHESRGEGFEYEIEEAMRCFRAGLIESPLMPHADTLATVETMDEIRRQIGLRYPDE